MPEETAAAPGASPGGTPQAPAPSTAAPAGAQPQQMTEEQAQALQEKLKNMSPGELKEFQKQQCIFCQIVSGKIPSKKIYEDEQIMAILDINPAAKGHLLLLPKEHYAIMPQVPDKVLGEMFLTARKLSQLQLKALKVSGTSLFIANGMAAGQKAQHFMIHLIPRKETDGVLADEEKIIDESEREKVIPLIEKRFNQLMGLKKDVVKVGKKVKEEESPPEPSPDHPPPAEVEKEPAETAPEQEPTMPAPDHPPLEEAIGGKVVEAEFEEEPAKTTPKKKAKKKASKGKKTKKTTKKKPAKKKSKKKPAKTTPDHPPLDESKEEYPEASLDDIAELFK